jgi:hypothetical protein
MKEPKAFREKEEVEPGAILASVERDKAWITRGKEREKLELLPVGSRTRPAAAAGPVAPPPAVGSDARPPAAAPDALPRSGSTASPPPPPDRSRAVAAPKSPEEEEEYEMSPQERRKRRQSRGSR